MPIKVFLISLSLLTNELIGMPIPIASTIHFDVILGDIPEDVIEICEITFSSKTKKAIINKILFITNIIHAIFHY